MDDEIRAAVEWWQARLRPNATEQELDRFGEALRAALPGHLQENGWEQAAGREPLFKYEDRVIGFIRGVAPVLLAACRAAGIDPGHLPRRTLMFIDPGRVAVAQGAAHPAVAGVEVSLPLEVVWKRA